MAPGKKKGAKGKAKPQAKVRFHQKLVLNQLMLAQFGVTSFDQLAAHLKDESLEGMDESNIHRFHHALCLHLPADQRPNLPDAVLLEFDQAIGSVTQRLNERRITLGESPIVWKYFQYLSLLFTEIYLDRYFRYADSLRAALTARIASFNVGMDDGNRQRQDAADACPHPPVPPVPRTSRPGLEIEPHHPPDAERRAVGAAPSRVQDGGYRRGGLQPEQTFDEVLTLGGRQLRTVRLKKTIKGRSTDADAFKRLGPIATVRPPDRANSVEVKSLLLVPLVVNWYRISVAEGQADIIAKLEELKDAIAQGKAKALDYRGLKAVWMNRHLYEPLLALEQGIIEIPRTTRSPSGRPFRRSRIVSPTRRCDSAPSSSPTPQPQRWNSCGA